MTHDVFARHTIAAGLYLVDCPQCRAGNATRHRAELFYCERCHTRLNVYWPDPEPAHPAGETHASDRTTPRPRASDGD